MRVLGIDPSSACVGLSLVVDQKLKWTRVWKPSNVKAPHSTRLKEYRKWLIQQIKLANPDIAAVEKLRHARGTDTIRVIAYYEGVSLEACSSRVVIVKHIQVTTARSHSLGRGNLGKQDSFKLVKRMFPNHKFKHFDQGGADESDATILAIAAPSVSERD